MQISKFTEYPKDSGVLVYSKGQRPILVSSNTVNQAALADHASNLLVHVYSGGTLSNVTLSNSVENVSKGGVITSGSIQDGTTVNVLNSGLVNHAVVGKTSNTRELAYADSDIVSSTSTVVTISHGAIISQAIEVTTVERVTEHRYIENYTPVETGVANVMYGGAISSATLADGGRLNVYASGVASAIAIAGEGTLQAASGAAVSNVSVDQQYNSAVDSRLQIMGDVTETREYVSGVYTLPPSGYYQLSSGTTNGAYLWWKPNGTVVSNIIALTPTDARENTSIVVVAGVDNVDDTYVLPITDVTEDVYFQKVKENRWFPKVINDPLNYTVLEKVETDKAYPKWAFVRYSKRSANGSAGWVSSAILSTYACSVTSIGALVPRNMPGARVVALESAVLSNVTVPPTGNVEITNATLNTCVISSAATLNVNGHTSASDVTISSGGNLLLCMPDDPSNGTTASPKISVGRFIGSFTVSGSAMWGRAYDGDVIYTASGTDIKPQLIMTGGAITVASGARVTGGLSGTSGATIAIANGAVAGSDGTSGVYGIGGVYASKCVLNIESKAIAYVGNLTSETELHATVDRYWNKSLRGIGAPGNPYPPSDMESVTWVKEDGAISIAALTESTIRLTVTGADATVIELTRSIELAKAAGEDMHDTNIIYGTPDQFYCIQDTAEGLNIIKYNSDKTEYTVLATNRTCVEASPWQSLNFGNCTGEVTINDRAYVSSISASLYQTYLFNGAAHCSILEGGTVLTGGDGTNILVRHLTFGDVHHVPRIDSMDFAKATVDIGVGNMFDIGAATGMVYIKGELGTTGSCHWGSVNPNVDLISCTAAGTNISCYAGQLDYAKDNQFSLTGSAYGVGLVGGGLNVLNTAIALDTIFTADGITTVGTSASFVHGRKYEGNTSDIDTVVSCQSSAFVDMLDDHKLIIQSSANGSWVDIATVNKGYAIQGSAIASKIVISQESHCFVTSDSGLANAPRVHNTPIWIGSDATYGYVIRTINNSFNILRGTIADSVYTHGTVLATCSGSTFSATSVKYRNPYAIINTAVKSSAAAITYTNNYRIVPANVSSAGIHYILDANAVQPGFFNANDNAGLVVDVVEPMKNADGKTVLVKYNHTDSWVNNGSTFYDSGYTVTQKGALTVHNRMILGVNIMSNGIMFPKTGCSAYNVTKGKGATITNNFGLSNWIVNGDATKADLILDGKLDDHLLIAGDMLTGLSYECAFSSITPDAAGDDRRWRCIDSTNIADKTVLRDMVLYANRIAANSTCWTISEAILSKYTLPGDKLEESVSHLSNTYWSSGTFYYSNNTMYHNSSAIGSMIAVNALSDNVRLSVPLSTIAATSNGSYALAKEGYNVVMYRYDMTENSYVIDDRLNYIEVGKTSSSYPLESTGAHTRDPWWIYRSNVPSGVNTNVFSTGCYIKRANTEAFYNANLTSKYSVWKITSGDTWQGVTSAITSGMLYSSCYLDSAAIANFNGPIGTMKDCSGFGCTLSAVNNAVIDGFSMPRGTLILNTVFDREYLNNVNLISAATLSVVSSRYMSDVASYVDERFVHVPKTGVAVSGYSGFTASIVYLGPHGVNGCMHHGSCAAYINNYFNNVYPWKDKARVVNSSNAVRMQRVNAYTDMTAEGYAGLVSDVLSLTSTHYPNVITCSGIIQNAIIRSGDVEKIRRYTVMLDTYLEDGASILYYDCKTLPKLNWVTPALTEHDTRSSYYAESRPVSLSGGDTSSGNVIMDSTWTPPTFGVSPTGGITAGKAINYLYKNTTAASEVISDTIVHVKPGTVYGGDAKLILGRRGGLFVDRFSIAMNLDVNSIINSSFNMSTTYGSPCLNSNMHNTHMAKAYAMDHGLIILHTYSGAAAASTVGESSSTLLNSKTLAWVTAGYGKVYVADTHDKPSGAGNIVGYVTSKGVTCTASTAIKTGVSSTIGGTKYTFSAICIYGSVSQVSATHSADTLDGGLLYIASSGSLYTPNLMMSSGNGTLIVEHNVSEGVKPLSCSQAYVGTNQRIILMNGADINFNEVNAAGNKVWYFAAKPAYIQVMSNFILSNMPCNASNGFPVVDGVCNTPSALSVASAFDIHNGLAGLSQSVTFNRTNNYTTVDGVSYHVYEGACMNQTMSMSYKSSIVRADGTSFNGWAIEGYFEPEPGSSANGILYACPNKNPIPYGWETISGRYWPPVVTAANERLRHYDDTMIKIYDCGHTVLSTDWDSAHVYPAVIHVNGVITSAATGEYHVGNAFCYEAGTIIPAGTGIIHVHNLNNYIHEAVPIHYANGSGTVVYHDCCILDHLSTNVYVSAVNGKLMYMDGTTPMHYVSAGDVTSCVAAFKNTSFVFSGTATGSSVVIPFVLRDCVCSGSNAVATFTHVMADVKMVSVSGYLCNRINCMNIEDGHITCYDSAVKVRLAGATTLTTYKYARNVIVSSGANLILSSGASIDNLKVLSGGSATINGYVTGYEEEEGAVVVVTDSKYLRTSSFYTKDYNW